MTLIEQSTLEFGEPRFVENEIVVSTATIMEVLESVDLDAGGYELRSSWRTVQGATGVEVDSAALVLHPPLATDTINLGEVHGGGTEVQIVTITIPGGERAIRTVKFNDFTRPDDDPDGDPIAIVDRADLLERLSVAIVAADGVGAPVHVVAPIRSQRAIPERFGGATFAGRVLTLPFLRAEKIQITMVTNDAPEDFERQPFSVSSIAVHVGAHPAGLSATGPAGTAVYSSPVPLGVGADPVTIDVTAPVQLAFDAAVVEEQPLEASITLRATTPGTVRTSGLVTSGAIVRTFAEPIEVELSGRTTMLELPGAPLDSRAPLSVAADLTISSDGLRRHELSDHVPEQIGGLAGSVVAANAVLRTFPPEALIGERVGRVGLVGRPVGACDLSVRLVAMAGTESAAHLGDPGVVRWDAAPTPSDEPGVVWIDLPDPPMIDGAVGLSATATRGSFLWVGEPDPLVLVAVVDDTPGPGRVTIGSTPVTTTGPTTVLLGESLAAGSFTAPPLVQSDMIGTLQLAHLTLRYTP